MNMDESITFSDVEVGWDHDSPTPAVWRMLQGPGRNEDTQCSPQLPRTRSMVHRHPRPSTDNHPAFEKSRKEVDQIINALRKVSKEGDAPKSNLERRLVIPDLPEEEESEDERNFETVPFKELSTNHTKLNTSIDLLFDMSGRGEDLALSMKSTNIVSESKKSQRQPAPSSDMWTDDELFTDDALMLVVDSALTSAPPKSKKRAKNENLTTRKTSTPLDSSKIPKPMKSAQSRAEGSTSNAKGFLDFFMDEGKPAKPSPQKEGSRVLPQKKNRYKFVSKGESSKTATNAVKRTSVRNEVTQSSTASATRSHSMANGNDHTMSRMGKTTFHKTANTAIHKSSMPDSSITNVTKQQNDFNGIKQFCGKESKPMETSIPFDLLELIAEDSWTETEEDVPKVPQRNVAKKPSTSSSTSITNNHKNTKLLTSNTTSVTNNHKNSYKFAKTSKSIAAVKNSPASVVNFNGFANKQIGAIKKENPNVSCDGFSSDDEDLLLEAVAMSESQKCAKGSSSSAPNPVKKAPTGEVVRSNPPSQNRCTASEIERKKQQALERKKQRMKQQRILR